MTEEKFNSLPKHKKAVLVAKDVLKQIQVKRYIPNRGRYISYVEFNDDYNFSSKQQINQQFDKIENCTVCAIGGMLLSCTHLGNKLTNNDLDLNHSCSVSSLDNYKIKFLFESKTLLMIETAFEGYFDWEYLKIFEIKKEKEDFLFDGGSDRFAKNILGFNNLSFEETLKCEMFKRKYKTDKRRLIAICNNIIKNKGQFIP